MALQVAAQVPAEFRHNGPLGNMMVGNDELEEGEASEANESNYGSDLYFPHLEDKLTEVLGHARKDFEGGIYAERLGSKFGGYGTFLPTVPAGPPSSSGPPPAPPRVRSSPSTQLPVIPPAPGSSETMKSQAPEGLKVAPAQAPEPSSDAKKTSSITLKIKVGSENRGKNSAIYNKLGFSSPSISEDDDDEMSGSESSPERSPTAMIQMILSHRVPTDGLLSPLPDFFSSPVLKSGSKSTTTTTKEATKDEPRKQAKKVAKEVTKVKPQEPGATKPSSNKKERERESSAAVAAAPPGISTKQSSKGRRDEEAETSKKKLKPSSTPGKPEEKKKAPQGKSKSHRDEESRSKSKLKAGVEPAVPAAAAPGPSVEPEVQPVNNLTGFANPEAAVLPLSVIKENWVLCDGCNQWRLLPPTMDPPNQERWLCEMISWLPPGMNNCKVSEETTTAEVYRSLGIQYPPPVPDPAMAPLASLAPLVPAGPLAPVTPAVPLPALKKAEEPPGKPSKASKHVMKKKEKSRHHQQQPVEADVGKSSKKKRPPADENPTSSYKKIKSEDGKRSVMDEDVDSVEKAGSRKASFKPDEISRRREKKEQKAQELPKAEEEQQQQLRDEQKEARKSSGASDPAREGKKASRPDKLSKSSKSSARVVDDAQENLAKPRSSSRPQDAKDQKRKLALGSCSPQVADSLDVLRSRAADSSAELRISSDGGGGDFSNHDRKNERALKRVSDQLGDAELEPAYRAKQAIDQPRETRKEHRKGGEDKEVANLCIKAGTSLKHTADRLKDETATDIYLQAALKFLQAAGLLVSSAASPLQVYNDPVTLGLYNDTARLFKFCGTQYEKVNDIPGAVLAYKCAAVVFFQLLMVKSVGMAKDRVDIEAALNRAPAQSQATPPTEGSPSSSSASDLDNLNMLTNSSGKSAVSPLVQASGTLPTTIVPALHRYMRNSADIFDALEISSKADGLLATLAASKVVSADKVAAVNRVGGIGFNDMEALVRIVNQALEALGR